jgi:hypothetical protein
LYNVVEELQGLRPRVVRFKGLRLSTQPDW